MIDYGEVKFETYDLKDWVDCRAKMANLVFDDEVRQAFINKIIEYPPIKAKDFTPPWYTKDHPLKRCYGISKIVNQGYILRAPIDIGLQNFLITPFEEKFTENFPFEMGDLPYVLKLTTPWMVKSDKPLDLIIMAPAYHFKSQIDFRIQSGILSAHKRLSWDASKKRRKKEEKIEPWQDDPFGEELNPLFVSKAEDRKEGEPPKIIFRQGYPMIQMIPVRS